ncbi:MULTISPECIES: NYN domain-containing protein [Asaia]|uniref:LabA-like NYN domain-containing protein n=1 Tax=Asaia TaxID=91914 RepID=UPI000EFC07A4|nr:MULTISPECIES: NYN domain-containing protein [Asaia]NIE78893.1 NYN domain-containing protein [Asaia sp. As-1742]
MLDKTEKTAVFIDGSSLYYTAKTLGFEVDYRRLLRYLKSGTRLIRAHYYAAIPETEEYSPLKPLTDWLAYNGYMLVTKTAREFTDQSGRRRLKGNMDVELAVDLLELADKIDHAVIFSGDADLRRAVEAIQRRGVRVTAVSSLRSSPPLIGDDLRRQVDQFVELGDIAAEFTRRQADTPVRPRSNPIRHPADVMPDNDLDD